MLESWGLKPESKIHVILLLTGMICGLIFYWSAKGVYEIFTDRQLAVECTQWPTTDGMIIKSRWRTRPDKRDYAVIEYLYEINSKEYVGERVSFNSQRIYQEELVEQYKQGNKVTVFYHPSDPELAVIESGNPEAIFGMKLLTRFSYLSVGCLGVWLILKNMRRKKG